MKTFNTYGFLEDLKDTIKESGAEDIWEIIHQEIDNAVIYYADCFAIVQELFVTDWKDHEFGEITNITQLAYTALHDYVSDNLEILA